MTNHTPGPFIIKPLLDWSGRFAILKGNDLHATTTNEANARLIAAAPCLLEAAIMLLSNAQFNDGQGIILTQDAESLERAIAKARGES